jgi:3-dehydroquinate dehydratase-1
MICVSLKEKNSETCIRLIRKIDFAEIRLDKMDVGLEDVRDIFSSHPNLIATFRPTLRGEKDRESLLLEAIEAGAAFVDIEIESKETFKNALIKKALECGCKVIVSYHNFKMTPVREELEHLIDWCFDSGADLAKLACMVQSNTDNVRLLGLLSDTKPKVVIGMGQLGKITRIVGPLLGSQFTYASLDEKKETAEGQINHILLRKILKSLKDA